MICRALHGTRSQLFTGLGAAALVFICGTGHSQPEASAQKFEVASIKSSRPDAKAPSDISPSGTVSMNTTVKSLIFMAYQIQEYQIAGAPKWLDSAQSTPRDQKSPGI
jgi:hypothetical protein